MSELAIPWYLPRCKCSMCRRQRVLTYADAYEISARVHGIAVKVQGDPDHDEAWRLYLSRGGAGLVA